MNEPQITVSEIFGPTCQGEGLVIGVPTVFIRLGGCDSRCSWCDSLYAVLPEFKGLWARMTAEQIVFRVGELTNGRPMLVTLSGGNPALQQSVWHLVELLQQGGYTVLMETQGTVVRSWMQTLDILCVSPKPPSSLMITDWARLDQVMALGAKSVYLKVVVFHQEDDPDYMYALKVHRKYPKVPFILQAGTQTQEHDLELDPTMAILESTRWLMEKFLHDLPAWGLDVRVLPQLHALVWGARTRAV